MSSTDAISYWLNWTPTEGQTIPDAAKSEVSKGTKPGFDTFETPLSRNKQIIQAEPCNCCRSLRFWVSIYGVKVCATCHPPASEELVKEWIGASMPEKQPGECPYTLPRGCKLVRFEKKPPPVAVTVCSVVTDIEKFIQRTLSELDARLHHSIQIAAGDSVFELLSKLADCGLELRLEWPPEPRRIQGSSESEVPKVTKPPETPEPEADEAEIPDEEASL